MPTSADRLAKLKPQTRQAHTLTKFPRRPILVINFLKGFYVENKVLAATVIVFLRFLSCLLT